MHDRYDAEAPLGAAARQAPFGMVVTDLLGRVLDANDHFLAMVEVAPDSVTGTRLLDLIAQHEHGGQRDLVLGALAGGAQNLYGEVTLLAGVERRPVPTVATASVVRGIAGEPQMILCRFESIAARRAAETSVLESMSTLDAILALDDSGCITSWNEGATRMLGWERPEILGRPLDTIRASGRVWRAGEMDELVADGGRRTVTVPRSLGRHKDGSLVPVEIRVAAWGPGSARSYTMVLRDVSDRVAAEKAALDRALTDPLTGLGTRRGLNDLLGPLVTGGGRTALALLDLDRFTMVNEALGHPAGDTLLCRIADRLREMAPPDRVFRTDGDEFALVLDLPTTEDGLDMTGVARRLDAWARDVLAAAAGPFSVDGVPVEVEGSMGLAVAPDQTRDVRTLLSQADVALSSAKEHRDAVVHWSVDRDGVTTAQMSLLGQLRDAITDGQLRLHYQPVQGPPGYVGPLHVEALVRWENPLRGLLGPGQFIPLAEPTRLIVPLTRWVMAEALRQRAEWAAQGLDAAVSVNVSPRAFARADVVSLASSLLAEHSCPPDRLVVEITESALHEDPVQARETLTALQGLGVLTALDDFGAGSTSLQLLRRFRVDELKLDILFVRDVVTSPFDAAVVEASIGLARSLGIRLVLEGVEDAACADLVRSLGAEHLQGYHVARPMPGADIPAWVTRSART